MESLRGIRMGSTFLTNIAPALGGALRNGQVDWNTQTMTSKTRNQFKIGNDEVGYIIYNRAINCINPAESPAVINAQTELYKLRWCELSIERADENRDGRWTIEEARRDLTEPEKADRDQDGVVTTKELLEHLESLSPWSARTSS